MNNAKSPALKHVQRMRQWREMGVPSVYGAIRKWHRMHRHQPRESDALLKLKTFIRMARPSERSEG
jgi:hypothetical protein